MKSGWIPFVAGIQPFPSSPQGKNHWLKHPVQQQRVCRVGATDKYFKLNHLQNRPLSRQGRTVVDFVSVKTSTPIAVGFVLFRFKNAEAWFGFNEKGVAHRNLLLRLLFSL